MIIVFNSNQFADERNLYLIMSVSIFLNMFAMDWFYQGIEEYRYIIIRSAIFKVFSLIGIFLFVKEVEHYEIYGLISVLAMSLSGVLNYLYSRKLVTLKLRDIKPLKHMKSLSVFFMITFVINIYTNLDQALLGFLVDSKSVAFMNRSKTITGIAVSISTAITNTTLPRASYYIQNDKENYDLLINRVPEYILWFTVPITIGCITLAESIMYILGGIEFIDASNLLKIVSLTIIFSPLSTYYQTQVLAASGKEKNGLHIAYITSIISLILNIILIPILGFIGAGIVQVISELTAVGLRYFVAKKKLGFSNLKLITHSTMSYVGAAIFMGAIVLLINSYISDYIVAFIVSVLSGGAIYIFSLLILREKVTLLALNSLRDKIQRFFDNMV
jgi:O-antigen/teichoic acid export membrane protein